MARLRVASRDGRGVVPVGLVSVLNQQDTQRRSNNIISSSRETPRRQLPRPSAHTTAKTRNSAKTRPGATQVRMEQYQAVLQEGALDPLTTVLAIWPSPMSYSGALFNLTIYDCYH